MADSESFSQFSLVNSDAAISIETPRSKFDVALEYEISIKEESRYIKKLKQYYFSSRVGLVLYVCGNDKIEKLIRRVDSELCQKHSTKVCTCLESDFHRPDKILSFTTYENKIFEIV